MDAEGLGRKLLLSLQKPSCERLSVRTHVHWRLLGDFLYSVPLNGQAYLILYAQCP